jgi:hypothetical protein
MSLEHRIARGAWVVWALALVACTETCPEGRNPGSLFCHGDEVDGSVPLPDAGEPCVGLDPGDPCGPARTCSPAGRCTCGDGTVDEGEECDDGRQNAAGSGCEVSCERTCDADRACPPSTDPCREDPACDLASFTCGSGRPRPAGTECGEGRVCDGEGACVGCDAEGTPCMPDDVCRTGTISCATGRPVCEEGAPLAPGTPCGAGRVCSADASCVECVAGSACTGSSACVEASIDCRTGAPECIDGALRPPGTPCGTDRVCAADGSCVPCVAMMSCAPSNPCREAAIDCSSGSPVCVDGAPRAPGSSCGTDRVCAPDASCVECREGAACTPENPCFEGVIRCATGSPVCEPTTLRPTRDECGPDLLCTSDGRCVQCLAPADCPTFGGEGIACDDPPSCQGTRGERTCSAEGTCGTRSGVPDDRACTTTTLARDCGLFRDLFCTGEESQTAPSCPTTCTGDSDCDPGAHCDGVTCIPDRPPGAPCERTVDCGGGLSCVDGVCCTSACTGTCVACNVAGFAGTCTPIPGGTDPSAECGGFSCRGFYAGFGGTNGDQCRFRADVSDALAACNGAGACQTAATLCPAQPAGSVQIDCNDTCQAPTGGTCVGTVAGACTNVDPGATSCGVGACRQVTAICTAGVPNMCVPGMPGTERCNGIDDDCNNVVDDSYAVDAPTWYRDVDGDGFGNPSVSVRACTRPPGHVSNASDCNDGNAGIRPGAPDPCDGVDQDCSGADGPPGVTCGRCGDGFIDPAYGEVCDTGGGAGCRSDCRAIVCDTASAGPDGDDASRFYIRPSTGTCYWFDSDVVGRSTAIAQCGSGGAYLVRWRNDPAERDDVRTNTHPGGNRVWIGLQRTGANNPAPANWTWDGEGVAVTSAELNWRSGEPSGDGTCVEWGGTGGNVLNDIACSNSRDFICERPRPGTVR